MNMYKKVNRVKYFYIGMVSLLIISLYGCKDFLNEPAQGTLSEITLANEKGLEGNLIAAYAVLDGHAGGSAWTASGSNWVMGEATSDNAHKGSFDTDQPGLSDVETLDWDTGLADQSIEEKWEIIFEAITRVNNVLRQINDLAEELNESERERIMGEALALRAFYNFEGYKVWGNFPFVPEDAKNFDIPNTEPILPKILNDINEAIDLLPPAQDDVGRVDKWQAKALKGKILMFDQQFDEALTTLREVVNSGPYDLEQNFREVFSSRTQNGTETILAYQASVNDGDSQGANGNWNERLNYPVGPDNQFGCCGFFQPTQNLVNAFQVDNDGLPLPVTQPNNWNTLDDNPDLDVPVDPRLDWTVGRPDVPYLDAGKPTSTWVKDRDFGGIYINKKRAYEERLKGEVSSNVGWATFQLHSLNLHLLRFGDVILLLAEAEVEVGSLENARQLVNQIRRRAAQAAQGPEDDIVVPIDDPRTIANYQIEEYPLGSFTDKTFARRAVRTERRLELAMEGQRFFDLRRWGIAEQAMNEYFEVEKTRKSFLNQANFQEKHNLYPIPSSAFDLSTSLQQNPGW